MNDNSLSRLYRRLTSARSADLAADELVAAVSGEADATRREAVAAKLATSAPEADLARLLNALQPASAELAEGVRRRGSAHPQRSREARPAHHARRVSHRPLRWVGGMAACLAVALGIVGVWHGKVDAPHHRNVVASASTAQMPDRIFTSQDRIFSSNDASEHHLSSKHGADKLFRTDFSGG